MKAEETKIDKKDTPLFSIIMAVYNVEEYIDEAVESVVKQTIGFRKIQLILVNDGSTDRSLEKCKEWEKRYPHQIVVLNKENGGQGSARNAGISVANGMILNFMDPDDVIDRNALAQVYSFFESNEQVVSVVCIPMHYFDARRGEHWQNVKFSQGTRVIDLKVEYTVQLTSASSSFFYHKDVEQLRFDESLPTSEDFKYVLSALQKKEKLGVVSDVHYRYRKRFSATSTLDHATKNRKWYKECFDLFYLPALRGENEQKAKLWVQYAIANDLYWRFRSNYESEMKSILSAQEQERYYSQLRECLSLIDTEVLMNQHVVPFEYRFQMIEYKYGSNMNVKYEASKGYILKCNGVDVFEVRNSEMKINEIHFIDQTIMISGEIWLYGQRILEGLSIFARVGNTIQQCDSYFTDTQQIIRDGETVNRAKVFSVNLQMNREINKQEIYLGIGENDKHICWITNLSRGPFLPLSIYPGGSGYEAGWKYVMSPSFIRVMPCNTVIKKVKRELVWEKTLLKVGAKKALLYRWLSFIVRMLTKKSIWLIADRDLNAGDNGEAIFRYLCKERRRSIEPVFLLSRESKDYPALKKVGKVIPNMGIKHKLLSLCADVLLTSSGRQQWLNCFDAQNEWNIDLLNRIPVVFLQHGIIMNNLSGWLNRWSMKLDGFVTSSFREYESIIQDGYGYTEKEVWLTGLPRYDRLFDHREKIILVMPTWRRNLMMRYDKDLGSWIAKPGLSDSQYCRFYHDFLNHDMLKELVEKYDYQIWFMPHPNVSLYVEDFGCPHWVKKIANSESYREIISKGSMMITDYSSVALDFAYLNKPIIYTQFDEDTFFHGMQAYVKGYYDYQKDGLGPVTATVEETIKKVEEILERDCEVEDCYKKRADKFYAYRDRNNCERVVKRVERLINLQLP